MKQPYRFGLLGQNISYSLSPEVFNYLFVLSGQAGRFEVIDCAPDELDAQLKLVREWDGFSVTVPYKKILLSRMDQISEDAKAIGAVNSVRVKDGGFYGFNTDAEGFWGPIEKISFKADLILILGNGGAAAAVVWVLAQKFPKADMDICGRHERKVNDFVDQLGPSLSKGRSIRGLTFDVLSADAEYDLIVNCTPVGGPSHPDASPLPDNFEFQRCRLCYDLNYRPVETVLMKQAKGNGCSIIGGYPMLVRQAVASYVIWTGCELDMEAVSDEIIRLTGGK